MTLEEFLLRLLVEAARDAAIRLAYCHADPLGQYRAEFELKYQLLDTALAIETTIDVWQVMERMKLRDLLKPIPITFDLSWEEAK